MRKKKTMERNVSSMDPQKISLNGDKIFQYRKKGEATVSFLSSQRKHYRNENEIINQFHWFNLLMNKTKLIPGTLMGIRLVFPVVPFNIFSKDCY